MKRDAQISEGQIAMLEARELLNGLAERWRGKTAGEERAFGNIDKLAGGDLILLKESHETPQVPDRTIGECKCHLQREDGRH